MCNFLFLTCNRVNLQDKTTILSETDSSSEEWDDVCNDEFSRLRMEEPNEEQDKVENDQLSRPRIEEWWSGLKEEDWDPEDYDDEWR